MENQVYPTDNNHYMSDDYQIQTELGEFGDYEFGPREADRKIHALRGSISTLKESMDARELESPECEEARVQCGTLRKRIGCLY